MLLLFAGCSYLETAIGDAQAVICATGATGFTGSNSAAAVDEKVRLWGIQLQVLLWSNVKYKLSQQPAN